MREENLLNDPHIKKIPENNSFREIDCFEVKKLSFLKKVSVCRQSLQTEQSERNEDIFGKKRASLYKSTAVEVFCQSP